MSIAPDLDAALAYSRYATAALAAHPEELDELVATLDAPFDWAGAKAALGAAAEAGEPRALAAALRRLRRRVFVHTLARDLTARADLAEVCANMTTLAETALRAAVALHHGALAAEHGEPRDENGEAQDLVVIGMGKLGGRELNVSSDVDLVFVYPEDGETDGARTLSNREFFERLGRRVIGALHEITPDGYVFRVDMRLRPYGESGPLAVPYSALEQYLITQGRAWERYAWLKARALTGTRHDELYALVTPFVFRKYLDYDAYEGLRDDPPPDRGARQAPRLRAEHQARPGGHPRDRVHRAGAADRSWRARARVARPRHLARAGRHCRSAACCPAGPSPRCADAYVFLRNVEHRLQYRDDRQTQTLPAEVAECDALARAMGCADDAAFDRALAAHRAAVSAQFAGLFGTAAARDPPDATASSSRDRSGTRRCRRSPRSGPTMSPRIPRARRWRRPDSRIPRDFSRTSHAFAPARDMSSCRRCRDSASTRWCLSCSPPPRRCPPTARTRSPCSIACSSCWKPSAGAAPISRC